MIWYGYWLAGWLIGQLLAGWFVLPYRCSAVEKRQIQSREVLLRCSAWLAPARLRAAKCLVEHTRCILLVERHGNTQSALQVAVSCAAIGWRLRGGVVRQQHQSRARQPVRVSAVRVCVRISGVTALGAALRPRALAALRTPCPSLLSSLSSLQPPSLVLGWMSARRLGKANAVVVAVVVVHWVHSCWKGHRDLLGLVAGMFKLILVLALA